jgi:hypothetical protein
VPKICEFYGVVIRMFYNEHGPPHFHADYGGARASVDFQGDVLRGELPRRALRLVREWTHLHQSDLVANWDLARSGRPLVPIEPLD